MTEQPKVYGVEKKRLARIGAVKALYSRSMNEEPKSVENLCQDMQEYFETNAEHQPDEALLKDLVQGVDEHEAALDEKIQSYLSEGWTFERLPVLLVAVLRCSFCEMLLHEDTPSKVIMNEYIEVAKAFLEDSEVSFVNGILDRLVKDTRSGV